MTWEPCPETGAGSVSSGGASGFADAKRAYNETQGGLLAERP